MGPLELGEIAKAKAVRAKLYGQPKPIFIRQVYYQEQPCSPDCDWARSMRIDGFSHVTVERIIQAVCDYYGLNHKDIVGIRRSIHIARPRQVVMFLSKHLTRCSFPQIGTKLGGRDHSTVLHGVRRIEKCVREDKELNKDVKLIRKELVGNAYWKIEGLDY